MWLKKLFKIGLKEATSILDAQKLDENEAILILRAGKEVNAKRIKLSDFQVEYKDVK